MKHSVSSFVDIQNDVRKLPDKSVTYLKQWMLLHLNRKGPPGANGKKDVLFFIYLETRVCSGPSLPVIFVIWIMSFGQMFAIACSDNGTSLWACECSFVNVLPLLDMQRYTFWCSRGDVLPLQYCIYHIYIYIPPWELRVTYPLPCKGLLESMIFRTSGLGWISDRCRTGYRVDLADVFFRSYRRASQDEDLFIWFLLRLCCSF